MSIRAEVAIQAFGKHAGRKEESKQERAIGRVKREVYKLPHMDASEDIV